MISLDKILEEVSYIDYKKGNDQKIENISNNSKNIKEGFAFVAVDGNISDGHKYIEDAYNNGARTIIHTKDIDYKDGINYIKVSDSRKALADIANLLYDYPSKKLTIAAVTGSNGKTTTARLISYLCDKIFGSSANIGTDLALIGDEEIRTSNTTPDVNEIDRLLDLAIKKDIGYVSIEASSHGLDQKRLEGVDIDYGVFTNLSREHLDYHKDMKNYFMAKMILFEKSHHQVTNIDDPYGKEAKKLFKDAITYGINEPCDYRASDIKKEDKKISFKINGVDFILNTIAVYEIYNTLAAVATVCSMGADLSEVSKHIEKFPGVKSRFEYIENDLSLNLIIDFAHTPLAFESIFKVLADKEKVYAVFGVNGDRDLEFRESIGRACAKNNVSVILTTDDPKFDSIDNINRDVIRAIEEYKGDYVIIKDRYEAVKYAIENAKPTDYVLFLGKGEENFLKLKGNEKTPYSERETIAKVLKNIWKFM